MAVLGRGTYVQQGLTGRTSKEIMYGKPLYRHGAKVSDDRK